MSLPVKLISKAITAGCLILAAMLGWFMVPANAAQGSGQFYVTATLLTAATAPSSAFCLSSNTPGSFGAHVTVVCSTGAVVDISPGSPATGMPWSPMHGGAYRFLTNISSASGFLGTVDSDTGPGTVTSWRLVNLADRDYLEMLVGW